MGSRSRSTSRHSIPPDLADAGGLEPLRVRVHRRVAARDDVAQPDDAPVALQAQLAAPACSAAGGTPAAAVFVTAVCRRSWNGRTWPATFAFASAARRVSA
jgi:hypothetical protein